MDSNKVDGNRRQFLKHTSAASVAALTALSGCSSLGDSESPDVEDVPDDKFIEPTISEDAMDSLEKTGDIKQVNENPGLTAYTAGNIYEVADLTEQVKAKTMGEFSDALMIFFAAKLNLEGLGTSIATPKQIANNSKDIVEQRLNDQGVEDTTEVDPSEPLPNHSSSETVEFRGTYETPQIKQEAELPNGEMLPIEIPSQDLPVVGMMTVWKQDKGTALMAGGGYPADDYETTAHSSVTNDLNDGIDISVSIDLNLQPQSLRRRMNELAMEVS